MWQKWATLQEIETHWSFEDVMIANEALQAIERAERKQQKKLEK